MDQHVVINLVIKKDDRSYQFSIQPGYKWDEIQAVLDEFKVEIEALKLVAIQAEKEAQDVK